MLVDVLQEYSHPKFDSDADYDFSILRLNKSFVLPKNVEFVKLPNENDKLQTDDEMFVTGWGETRNSKESEQFLRGVKVPIYDYDKCKRAYASIDLKVTDRMICAGYDEGGEFSNEQNACCLVTNCFDSMQRSIRAVVTAEDR